MNKTCEQALWTSDKKKKRWTKLGSKSLKKNCEQMLLTRVVNKRCEKKLWTKHFNKSYDKICEKELLTGSVNKTCEEYLLTKVVNKSCTQK